MSSDASPQSQTMGAAVRPQRIYPHFHLKLAAGYGFEVAVQSHGNGMWIASLSLYAPWNRKRPAIHELFRYEFVPRSFDFQVRLKRTMWAKKVGFCGNHKRRFLYLGPLVFALDRLQPLADKEEWPQLGRWDWGAERLAVENAHKELIP